MPRRYAPTLVIGYGNTLRGDDGVGPRVAEAVAAWGLPYVRAIAIQQLLPELAEELAAARRALFVDAYAADAALGVAPVRVRRLRTGDRPGAIAHSGEPAQLLALAATLYGRSPPAWLVALPAYRLEIAEALSPAAERAVAVALCRVRRLIGARPTVAFS